MSLHHNTCGMRARSARIFCDDGCAMSPTKKRYKQLVGCERAALVSLISQNLIKVFTILPTTVLAMNDDAVENTLRYRYAVALVAGWVALVVLGFWWFSARFFMPFGEVLVSFDGRDIAAQSPSLNEVTVVGLIDKECACSGFAESHWSDLQREYPHVVFERASTTNRWSFLLQSVGVSPAVAVWNADGRLVYLGPFSSGSMCGSGDDFVAMTLGSLAASDPVQWINQDAVGCFCRSEHGSEET
jgi:hypothetical protein